MRALIDPETVDRIEVEAREIRFGRTVLTIFAAVFFAVGWLAAKGWLAVAWSMAAVKVGWQEAHTPHAERGARSG